MEGWKDEKAGKGGENDLWSGEWKDRRILNNQGSTECCFFYRWREARQAHMGTTLDSHHDLLNNFHSLSSSLHLLRLCIIIPHTYSTIVHDPYDSVLTILNSGVSIQNFMIKLSLSTTFPIRTSPIQLSTASGRKSTKQQLGSFSVVRIMVDGSIFLV